MSSLGITPSENFRFSLTPLFYDGAMEKDFDRWNEIKKNIDTEQDDPYKFPKEGEVWMSSLGINIGYEQNGIGDKFSRPVLIIKKFNNHMFWCIPLSTKQKEFDFYFNYTDPNEEKVSAILAQMKLISIKRITRKIYDLDIENLNAIRAKLIYLLENRNPA